MRSVCSVLTDLWALAVLAFSCSKGALGEQESNSHGIGSDAKGTDVDFVQPQVEWLRSKGGFVSDKIEIRRVHPENMNSRFGVFAKEDLAEMEEILVIPRSAVISTESEGSDWVCESVNNLMSEIELGEKSDYAPFVKYLKHYLDHPQQHGGRNPSVWTNASKALLLEILGAREGKDKGILPPRIPVGWIDQWKELCEGGDNQFEQHIVTLVKTRAWDDMFIPMYDYFGHRNGRWHNTEMSSVYDQDEDITVRALRPIKAKEEIYTSYDSCAECSSRGLEYGSPEILRDYGFVESFPQKWIFPDQEVGFTLDQKHNPDGSLVEGSELVMTWLDSQALTDGKRPFFEKQLTRLRALGETSMKNRNDEVPTDEWEIIQKYWHALIVALERLLTNGGINDKPHQSEFDFIQPQIDWVRSKGGYISESIEIRRVHPENPYSRFGVFATQEIPPSELIMSIPQEVMIWSGAEEINWICDTTFSLIEEIELGEESDYAPYIDYLKVFIERKQQHGGQNPGVWSDAGKALLFKVLDKQPGMAAILPPEEPDWVESDWKADCELGDNPYHQHVAALVMTRGADDNVMIPMYDFLAHRNGRWTNTETTSFLDITEEDFHVRSKQVIHAGEELFTSYDSCVGCLGREVNYGTPEILRDYGFVESFPQRWTFAKENVAFTLDQDYAADGKPVNSSNLKLTWIDKHAVRDEKIDFFKQQLERLKRIQETDLKSRNDDIPSQEWETIVSYSHNLAVAIDELLKVHANREKDAFDKERLHSGLGELSEIDLVKAEIDWVRSQGGYVSEHIEFRRVDPGNRNSRLGAFATQDIPESELLLTIPRSCTISSDTDTDRKWLCETTDNLLNEISLGEESEYAPYINYLRFYMMRRAGLNPSLWSDSGKRFLVRILGKHTHTGAVESVLPPVDPVGWIDHDWVEKCEGGDDPFEHEVAMLILSSGWDDLLIPIFDLFAHRNGRWHNAGSNSVHDQDDDIHVRSLRSIKAGEEIYTSYDSCLDCSGRGEEYGTPEILRDYGFVENFPQKWIFHDQDVACVLDQDYDDNDSAVNASNLTLTWLGEPPKESKLDFFEQEIERLRDLGETVQAHKHLLPLQEWELIDSFYQALVRALTVVLEVAIKDLESEEDEDCTDGLCVVSNTRYDTLSEPFDDEGYEEYTCDIDESMDLKQYKTVQSVPSPFKDIPDLAFVHNPETRDTCLSLDMSVESCGSYRGHYNELMVHYGAQFLDKVWRVIWVGGEGHSMLLHEILKYPIELVIGFEADQKITRYGFKHFGTQPHWDDDRVQWWYGDVAKGLAMLPAELFGTFDLVLVDFQETFTPVTDDFDIMGVLSTLLKPNGIFVKDELYMEPLKHFFKYTIQIHLYNVPFVCSQGFILGSHANDFLQANLVDHSIESHVFKPWSQSVSRYDLIHDYVKNESPKEYCRNESQVATQTRIRGHRDNKGKSRQGIFMVLEAENALLLPNSPETLEYAVMNAIKMEGFNVVSFVTAPAAVPMVIIILHEGYVAARMWPDFKYCAFDIHLWSHYEKIDSLKLSLLSSVGSEKRSSSSFRVTVGGMFGGTSEKMEKTAIGPQRNKICNSPPKILQKPQEDMHLVEVALKESINMLNETTLLVLVICGPKSIRCMGIDVFSGQNSIVKQVVPLWTCPEIEGGVEFHQDATQKMYECETDLVMTLKMLFESQRRKIGVAVLDPSAPFEMAQIFLKIMSRIKNRRPFFSSGLMVLAPIINKMDRWRGIFTDKFRTFYLEEPVWRSEVLFKNSQMDLEMGSFFSGDKDFIKHLVELTASVEMKTGASSEIRVIEGGVFKIQEDFKPSVFLLPGHYDQGPSYEQWSTQQPCGYQTIVQMEVVKENSTMSCGKVKSLLENVLRKMHIQVTFGTQTIKGFGEGCVTVAMWMGGSILLSWDGRDHFDLNLFMLQENLLGATTLVEKLVRSMSKVQMSRRDDMPRGHGRVVNFQSDLEPRQDPHWAVNIE